MVNEYSSGFAHWIVVAQYNRDPETGDWIVTYPKRHVESIPSIKINETSIISAREYGDIMNSLALLIASDLTNEEFLEEFNNLGYESFMLHRILSNDLPFLVYLTEQYSRPFFKRLIEELISNKK